MNGLFRGRKKKIERELSAKKLQLSTVRFKVNSVSEKRAYLEKQLVPQFMEKARKHCAKLLQGSTDPMKVWTAMYDCDWGRDIWDNPDESDGKVINSVLMCPLKQEITNGAPQGDNPQKPETTKVQDFKTYDLQKAPGTYQKQPVESIAEWLC